MIRINLLPHREQARQERQRQFVSLAIGLAILGLATIGLGHVIMASRIENQEGRNTLLKTEIAKLDEQIKEIDKLREQTQALLARKQVDTKVTMIGYAQSNARVSTLMRNIESSPWLQQPALVEIKSVALPNSREGRVSEFTLNFRVKRAAPPEPGESASARPPAAAKGGAKG